MTTGTIEFTCDGLTECGEQTHEPHHVKNTGTFQCRGLCKCKVLPFIHNPGAHK